MFENKFKIKSISLCSSFFLCLQSQPELCSIYHLLQSCFSFFFGLHGILEQFGNTIFSRLVFFFLRPSPEPFFLSFLSNSISSPRYNLLRMAKRYFLWSSVSFLRIILILSFLCSSVSEALFALSFSFLCEYFSSIHAKAALAYSRNE